MQKTIRILTVVATVLVACSLLILLIMIPFQRMVAMGILGYSESVIAPLPMFPVVPFMKGVIRLICVALLILCCGNKKGGIWMELVILVLMALVVPGAEKILTAEYNLLVAQRGSAYMVASNVVSSISAYCMSPANLGVILAYVCGGMSIAFKRMNKKLEAKNQEESIEEDLFTE